MDRIKSDLRTRMSQYRLNALAILNFNSKSLDLIDFNEVIREFDKLYTRRVAFK